MSKNIDSQVIDFLNTYNPLISKYSRKLKYEDAKNDIDLFMLELYKKMPEFKHPAQKTVYVNTAIRNEYIRLSKNKQNINSHEVFNDIAIELYSIEDNPILLMDIKMFLNKLSKKEKSIIYSIYFKDLKEVELAKQMNISKQAINNTKTSQEALLYQKPVSPSINVKNYLTAAWQVAPLAAGSHFDVTLPLEIEVGAGENVKSGALRTNLLEAEYNSVFNIKQDNSPLKTLMLEQGDSDENLNTITVSNKVPHEEKTVFAFKNKSPLFAVNLLSKEHINFRIDPKIYVARSRGAKKGTFFDAAVLSDVTTEISYEGNQYLIVEFVDNTEQVDVKYHFVKDIPDFANQIDMEVLFPRI